MLDEDEDDGVSVLLREWWTVEVTDRIGCLTVDILPTEEFDTQEEALEKAFRYARAFLNKDYEISVGHYEHGNDFDAEESVLSIRLYGDMD